MDLPAAVDAVQHALATGKDISRSVSEWWKVWITLGAVLLALGWGALPRRVANGLLLVLTLWAGANYARFGPKALLEQVDTYDLIHYYLNAKYFDELGYLDLYPACIVADHENNGPYYDEGKRYMAQDAVHGHQLRPIADALVTGAQAKARFTPERWAAFTHDFLYLQRVEKGLTDETWRQLIQDHGFNGTVVWLLEASPLVHVPVESVKLLGWVDVGLLAVAVGVVVWAYGGATGLWVTLFLFVTYSTRWPTFTWALLRYDYVAALLIGMALLKRGKGFAAGLFTAWGAALRFFPAMWLFGPTAKGLFSLLDRKVHRPVLVLFAGFAVGVAVLQGAATIAYGGETVATHFENMEDHNASLNLSSRRIGLALGLAYDGELLPKNLPKSTKEEVERQKPLRFALSGVMLLALGWGLRRMDDDEGYAFGFLPFFLLTTASYYYYVARATLIVLHASRLPKARHTVGLAWLLGLETFSNWAETTYPEHRVFLIGWLAWGLAAYGVGMAVWTVVEGRSVKGSP